jgi:hypothetical protein
MTNSSNRYLIAFKKRVHQILNYTPLYFKGKPLTLKIWTFVFKITFTKKSVLQLKHEIENTLNARLNPEFSKIAVKLSKVLPFLAMSRLIKETGDTAKRLSKMIDFSFKYSGSLGQLEFKKAKNILSDQIDNHIVDLNSVLLKKFKKTINTDFFNFKVPVTFMHGDFNNQNAILNDSDLYLIDWEYASQHGSFLYDWWFLRRDLDRYKDLVNQHDYNRFNNLIVSTIDSIGISPTQFDAFGHAMHAIIDFGRIEIRGGKKDVLDFSIKSVKKITSASFSNHQMKQ